MSDKYEAISISTVVALVCATILLMLCLAKGCSKDAQDYHVKCIAAANGNPEALELCRNAQ